MLCLAGKGLRVMQGLRLRLQSVEARAVEQLSIQAFAVPWISYCNLRATHAQSILSRLRFELLSICSA